MADDRLRLYVRVTPKAARTEMAGSGTGSDGRKHLKLRVNALPDKGAANREATRGLAKALGLARSDITLESGKTSRLKCFSVPDSETVRKALLEWEKDA